MQHESSHTTFASFRSQTQRVIVIIVVDSWLHIVTSLLLHNPHGCHRVPFDVVAFRLRLQHSHPRLYLHRRRQCGVFPAGLRMSSFTTAGISGALAVSELRHVKPLTAVRIHGGVEQRTTTAQHVKSHLASLVSQTLTVWCTQTNLINSSKARVPGDLNALLTLLQVAELEADCM